MGPLTGRCAQKIIKRTNGSPKSKRRKQSRIGRGYAYLIHYLDNGARSNLVLKTLPMLCCARGWNQKSGISCLSSLRLRLAQQVQRGKQGEKFMEWVSEMMEGDEQVTADKLKPDILQAMMWMRDAWREVKTETMVNCWNHTRILPADISAPPATI